MGSTSRCSSSVPLDELLDGVGADSDTVGLEDEADDLVAVSLLHLVNGGLWTSVRAAWPTISRVSTVKTCGFAVLSKGSVLSFPERIVATVAVAGLLSKVPVP